MSFAIHVFSNTWTMSEKGHGKNVPPAKTQSTRKTSGGPLSLKLETQSKDQINPQLLQSQDSKSSSDLWWGINQIYVSSTKQQTAQRYLNLSYPQFEIKVMRRAASGLAMKNISARLSLTICLLYGKTCRKRCRARASSKCRLLRKRLHTMNTFFPTQVVLSRAWKKRSKMKSQFSWVSNSSTSRSQRSLKRKSQKKKEYSQRRES